MANASTAPTSSAAPANYPINSTLTTQPFKSPLTTPHQLQLQLQLSNTSTDQFDQANLNHSFILSSTSYQNSSDLIDFNINQIHDTDFNLPQHPSATSSSSAPAHISLFDFNHQDINLFDCLNSQSAPLSAPPLQSIQPNKLHLPLTLEGSISAIHGVDQSQFIPESNSLYFHDSLDQRLSHLSHTTTQGSLNPYSILPPPTSASQLSLVIAPPHPATISPYPSQPPLPDRLSVLDSIKTLPSSFQANQFYPDDIQPPPITHDSQGLDLPPNSLQAHFINSQANCEHQMLFQIDPFEDITTLAGSEKPKGTTRIKYNRTATSTLSQDFRRRKDWKKRLIEDIEDVIQVVTPRGEFLFLSESMSRLTGFPTSEILSSKLFDWCFEDEDSVNLKRGLKNCTQLGKQLNLYCRFKKKNSDGFVILEMCGHMIGTKETEKETGNGQAIYITGRLYPTSCGRLMDNFLELTIENEIMMRKLLNHEKETTERSEGEEEEEEPNEALQKLKSKSPPKLDPLVDKEEESEKEQDHNTESLSHQIIGRDYSSRPRKRPKKDKVEFLCLDCGVTQSPEWRKGPKGRKTLCNACGLRYAKKGHVVNNGTLTK